MSDKLFKTKQEVADTLGMSKAYIYELIQDMVKGGNVVLNCKINQSLFFKKIMQMKQKM